MGDSTLHDIKQLLQDVLGKVVVLEGKVISMEDGINAVSTKMSAVDDEVAAVKADQGRLHVAINTVQSKHIDAVATSGTFGRDAPASSIGGAVLNAASHKLRFPKYDGSGDPLPWLHRCDQFFLVARTAEVEKVWLATFYMEGIAQQWYYRFERNRLDNNQGDPSWSQFCELVNQRLVHQRAATRWANCVIFAVQARSTTISLNPHLARTLWRRDGATTDCHLYDRSWGSPTYRRRASEAPNTGRGGGSCQSLRTTTLVRHE
jgi:hypothetical protein